MDFVRRPHLPEICAYSDPPLQKTPVFALVDTACLTAWTLYKYNRQQANFGTCYVVARAYGLEQQNTGRVLAGLCHASINFAVCRDAARRAGSSTTAELLVRFWCRALDFKLALLSVSF